MGCAGSKDDAQEAPGLLCGTTQIVNGTSVDLRSYPYLYFTDPFRLFSSIEVDFAPSMCVESCPGASDACLLSGLPCTANNQYRCPYYQNVSQYDLTTSEQPYQDEYFSALTSTTLASCTASTTGIPSAFSQYQNSFVTTGASGSALCGESFQLSSQYPSQGPCYAVWAPTIPWFNRQVSAP
ncbi:hypothetical protein WJX84_005110 [Apatococcus fuscideae]|uniref:Uncharacterized protein n=1 Tax=Apatococcus fuscideae TaxID=2026836 RepID=A0AAW1ST53_9CHLO